MLLLQQIKDEFLVLLQRQKLSFYWLLLLKAKAKSLLGIIAIDKNQIIRNLNMIFLNKMADPLGIELLEL